MSKKIITLCLALILCLGMAGCVRVRATITVKENGKIDADLLYAFNDSFKEMMGEEGSLLSEEDLAEYKENGFTVNPYSADGYSGYVLSKKDFDPSGENLMDSEISLKKEGSKYILDIPWSPEREDASSLIGASAMISSQGGFAEFVIILPAKPDVHNATSVSEDGKTLTWNLLAMGDRQSVHVEFSAASMLKTWLIRIGLILAGLLVLAGIIFLIAKLVRSAKQNRAVPDAPPVQESETVRQLREYKRLLDEGILTQEDFDKKKQEVLGTAGYERSQD